MNRQDSDTSDSESSNRSAAKRIQSVMDEIFKHTNKATTKEDIEKMADHCTNMLTKMKTSEKSKKVNKTPNNCFSKQGGSGDHASSKGSSKGGPRDLLKASQDEFMATLMGGSSLRDLMKKQKERPNVGEIYKQKLADKMKKLQVPTSKGSLEKTKIWRGQHEASSKSSKSSGSNSSTETSEGEGSVEKELAKIHQDLVKKTPKDKAPVSEFEAAKKKAQEWLKHQTPAHAKDGRHRVQLEDLSSGSDMDSFPSKLTLMKKKEHLLKSKIASMSDSKALPKPKNLSNLSSSKITPSPQKKTTGVFKPLATPSVPTTKKTVKKPK